MKGVRGYHPQENFDILYRKWCILEHFYYKKVHYKKYMC